MGKPVLGGEISKRFSIVVIKRLNRQTKTKDFLFCLLKQKKTVRTHSTGDIGERFSIVLKNPPPRKHPKVAFSILLDRPNN
jgi:hypothetical protein